MCTYFILKIYIVIFIYIKHLCQQYILFIYATLFKDYSGTFIIS